MHAPTQVWNSYIHVTDSYYYLLSKCTTKIRFSHWASVKLSRSTRSVTEAKSYALSADFDYAYPSLLLNRFEVNLRHLTKRNKLKEVRTITEASGLRRVYTKKDINKFLSWDLLKAPQIYYRVQCTTKPLASFFKIEKFRWRMHRKFWWIHLLTIKRQYSLPAQNSPVIEDSRVHVWYMASNSQVLTTWRFKYLRAVEATYINCEKIIDLLSILVGEGDWLYAWRLFFREFPWLITCQIIIFLWVYQNSKKNQA